MMKYIRLHLLCIYTLCIYAFKKAPIININTNCKFYYFSGSGEDFYVFSNKHLIRRLIKFAIN